VARPYTAKKNESLCIIAIREGKFLNCDSLRNASGNEAYKNTQIKKGEKVNIPDKEEKEESEKDKKKHKHKKKNAPIPQVRFVHGSKDKDAKDDTPLTDLQISNFRTDKAGFNQDKDFPDTSKFNANADIDPDTFKIEVVDAEAKKKGKNEVELELEVLKPVYKNDGSIKCLEPFKTNETTPISENKYKIKVKCKQIKNESIRYRSKYMRLVVDEEDFKAASGQTLLIPNIADGKDGDKDKIEILDQQVQATYELLSCPKSGGAKCKAYCHVPVGEQSEKKRVKLTVHILQKTRGGDGVITIEEARKGCLQVIRKIYAQAQLSIKFIDPKVRLVQPPTNMIAISDKNNPPGAEGGKKVKFKITIDKGPTSKEKTLEYTTIKDELPKKTAETLAGKIKTLFSADFNDLTVTSSANPTYKKGSTVYYTADVLIGDPQKYKVKINREEQNDSKQKFYRWRITSTNIKDFEGYRSHVGTSDERILLKNYDSGTDRIDMIIVGSLAGAWGEGFRRRQFLQVEKDNSDKQLIDKLVNSVIIDHSVFTSINEAYSTIPHELGHALMDIGIHVKRATDLMVSGTNGNKVSDSDEYKVGGPKRISDQELDFDNGTTKGNPITYMRDNNGDVIDAW